MLDPLRPDVAAARRLQQQAARSARAHAVALAASRARADQIIIETEQRMTISRACAVAQLRALSLDGESHVSHRRR